MKNKGYFIGNKSKRNKVILFVVISLIIFVPSILAFINYSIKLNEDKPISDKLVKVSLYEGDELLYEESENPLVAESSSLVYIFDSIIGTLSETEKAPDLSSYKKELYAIIIKEGVTYEHKYYFSDKEDNSYCVNNDGKIYRISNQNSIAFMSSKYAEVLYDNSNPPNLLTTSNDIVLPINADWKYKDAYGNILTASKFDTADNTDITYDMAGVLGLDFEVEPEKCNVKIYKSGIIEQEISHTSLSRVKVDTGTTLRLVVEATWEKDSNSLFYGTVNYDFNIILRDRSEFIIDRTTVYAGDFLTVACTNIMNIKRVSFRSEPSIGFSPVFFSDSDIVRTVIPLSHDIKAGDYKFIFSYGATQETIDIKVLERSDNDTVIVNPTYQVLFNSSVREKSISELENIISSLDTSKSQYIFCRDSFAQAPDSTANILYSYGTDFELQSRNLLHSVLGTLYAFPNASGNAVKALNSGVVVYSGSCDYLGNFIIIEHGLGIRTVYGRLSSINVAVGDIVKSGESIGRAGRLADIENDVVFIQCYVYNTAVDYTSIAGKKLDFSAIE